MRASHDPLGYREARYRRRALRVVLCLLGLSTGYFHSFASLVDGTVMCWGANDSGQLGAGLTPDLVPRPTPVNVAV